MTTHANKRVHGRARNKGYIGTVRAEHVQQEAAQSVQEAVETPFPAPPHHRTRADEAPTSTYPPSILPKIRKADKKYR